MIPLTISADSLRAALDAVSLTGTNHRLRRERERDTLALREVGTVPGSVTLKCDVFRDNEMW